MKLYHSGIILAALLITSLSFAKPPDKGNKNEDAFDFTEFMDVMTLDADLFIESMGYTWP